MSSMIQSHPVPNPRDKPVLSVPEAGAILGLKRAAAYAAAAKGYFPTIRFGARVVVPTAAFRRFLFIDDEQPADPAASQSS